MKSSLVRFVYPTTFFYTLHYALLVYVNASFLETILSVTQVQYLYAISALITLILLGVLPRIINQVGVSPAMSASLFGLSASSLLVAGGNISSATTALLFVIMFASHGIVRYLLDVAVEAYTKNNQTGLVRGVFLTIINVAFVVSPIVVGPLIDNFGFPIIYLLGSLATGIAAVWAIKQEIPLHKNRRVLDIAKALRTIGKTTSTRNITIAAFLLEIFYAWMVVYTPIYLSRELGFSWSEIGLIFSIMLIPFVLFELPAGYIADKKIGEKELLLAGFLIIGSSTIIFSRLVIPSVAIFASVLFFTRVGASLIEIMTESYFFKQISADQTDAMSVFRATRPLALLVGPLIGAILLPILGYSGLFTLLGIGLILAGTAAIAPITDTR